MTANFLFDNLSQHGDRTACIGENGLSLSYRDLVVRADYLVKNLKSGELIFCLVDNSVDYLVLYSGLMRKKIVPLLLPINVKYEHLLNLVQLYRPKYLCLPKTFTGVPNKYTQVNEIGAGFIYEHQTSFSNLNPKLALLCTTSGSTGNIKLVRLSRQNIQSNANSIIEYLKIKPSSKAITTLPFNYSYGLSIIHTHLHVGGLIVMNNNSLAENAFWVKLEKYLPNHMGGVPFTYEILKRFENRFFEINTIKTLTQAGGKLSNELVRHFAEKSHQNQVDFFVMYGQTEATARISYLTTQDAILKPDSIGKAIPAGKLSLLDNENKSVNSEGIEGQIVYEGENVSLGYAMSAEDLNLGDINFGRLLTGDLGKFDSEGFFYITGRISRIAKIHGVRINLQEIDDYLSTLNVVSATVSDDLKIYVYIERGVDEAEMSMKISQFLNIRISALEIRILPILPRTISGKIDFAKLTAKAKLL